MKRSFLWATAALAATLALVLTGCQLATDIGAAPDTGSGKPIVTMAYSGQIIEKGTNAPIEGAEVRVGTQSVKTDADGFFRFEGLISGDYKLRVLYEREVKVGKEKVVTKFTTLSDLTFSVMTLEEFKDAIAGGAPAADTADGKDGSWTGVASKFNKESYSYEKDAGDPIAIAPASSSLSGKALILADFDVDSAAQRTQAVPAALGSTLSLYVIDSADTYKFASTTVTDAEGSFVFDGLPAWPYAADDIYLFYTNPNGAKAQVQGSRFNGDGSDASSTTIDLVPEDEVSIGTIYFATYETPALELLATNLKDAHDNKIVDLAVTTAPLLTFSIPLLGFDPEDTWLKEVSGDQDTVDVVVTKDGATLKVTPTSSLEANTKYQLNYSVWGANGAISTDNIEFETASAGAAGVTDLALDTLEVPAYEAGATDIYVSFTANANVAEYKAQYKKASGIAWAAADDYIPQSVSGATTYAKIVVPADKWDSGESLQVRLVAVDSARALTASYPSNVITVSDTLAPTTGMIESKTEDGATTIIASSTTFDESTYEFTATTSGLTLGDRFEIAIGLGSGGEDEALQIASVTAVDYDEFQAYLADSTSPLTGVALTAAGPYQFIGTRVTGSVSATDASGKPFVNRVAHLKFKKNIEDLATDTVFSVSHPNGIVLRIVLKDAAGNQFNPYIGTVESATVDVHTGLEIRIQN